MIEDPIPARIGGVTYLCPPMPFYCLERAWPHIRKLAQMSTLNDMLRAAEMQARMAETPEAHEAATAAVHAASTLIDAEGADFVGQTREVIHIIAITLALDDNPPSYDSLSRQVRPNELAGLHETFSALMDASGLMGGRPGEARATIPQMPGLSNGAGSSLN